ncbi:phosphohistidine phosphatase SixA [Pseudomonadales bacterium]|nr:phosphohistidine phosphatase SixA [Pseudomonadales bacterium]MDB9879807.1 phosphohistidine phosphatase SixA [Pseudomonadales bacterium]
MNLLLMRHGDAVMSYPDADRPLSLLGATEVMANGASLLEANVKVSHIIASPLSRAQETAGLMATRLGYHDAILSWDSLSPAGDIGQVLALLATSDFENPLLVTHQPFVSEFIDYLTSEVVMMGTASIVAITLDVFLPQASELKWSIDTCG